MKNKLLISLAILVSSLGSFALTNNSNSKVEEVNASSTTYTKAKVDVTKFQTTLNDEKKSTVLTIDEEKQTLTTNGAWDSGFASTNQFDTLASSYYLKAHCYNASQGDSLDGNVGFNFYYDNINTLNFYLHWSSTSFSGSIAEAVFLAHIDGADSNAYESAILPNGVFQLRSTFTDCWTDYGGWTTGNDRDSGKTTNMRTSGSTVMLNKGFDMTLYVDRAIYRNRLVDIMQIQVDAYAGDGVTPKTFFTPKYAVDAFTAPKGNESRFAYIKPQIGFWVYNMGNVTFSDIEFGSNRVDKVTNAKFSTVGTTPEKADIDNSTGEIVYNNNNFNSGFLLSDNMEVTSPRVDFQAHVSGNLGDVEGVALGYVFYYDDLNYVILFLEWNGKTGTIDGFHTLVTLNGSSENVYQGARNPWEDPNVTSDATGYSTIETFADMWSDNSGFTTDAEFPCGVDENFNNFTSEVSLTLQTGFDMGVIRRRTTFLSRTIDEYQMYMIATGNDGKTHTWYTPLWCMDAFTYPNGGEEASSLIDEIPMLGFYAYQAGDVTINNLKLNGSTIFPKDISKLTFGSREENDWILTGSDLASNWTLSDNSLTESWEELTVNSHYGEVNALTSNEETNTYMSAKLSLSRCFGDVSYVGMYPYYLNKNNYLLVYLQNKGDNANLVVTGKLNGEFLGGVEWLLDKTLTTTIEDKTLLEIGLNDNDVNIYVGQTPKPTYSFNFEKQNFKERTLENARVGFEFYNANGNIDEFIIGSSERINPFSPSEEDIPTIFEFGTRQTSGSVGYSFELPTFVAFDYLNEALDVVITIYDENGNLVQTLDNGVSNFTVNEVGTYTVKVNATDEWGHSAKEISYKVNFTNYLGPGETLPKEVLWQTVVVLCFFGFILLITIGCGLLLLKKNRKEALRAAELNRKNHEKNLIDDEEDE